MENKSKQEQVPLLSLEPNLVLLLSAIAIPVIILGSVIILGTVRSEMNQLVGNNLLGGAADDTARQLDGYLLSSVTTVAIVAKSPPLHEAVDAANASYRGNPEAIVSSLRVNDEVWVKSRGALQLALDIVGAPASDYLREIQSIRPAYKEILLTDRFGALVAATNISSDYYQADEQWWRDAYGDGDLGSIYLGDVTFDRSAGAHTLEVAVPIWKDHGDDDTEVTGVLKALIGAEELFSVVGSVGRGETGHALLVDTTDGTVITGTDTGDVMKRQYPGINQLKAHLVDGPRSFISQQPDGVWLASFARMPQPSAAPFGHWAVVVQQLHSEVNGPIRRATISLVAFFIGMVVLVLAFSLYLHYRLVKPIREVDLREEMDRLPESESVASS